MSIQSQKTSFSKKLERRIQYNLSKMEHGSLDSGRRYKESPNFQTITSSQTNIRTTTPGKIVTPEQDFSRYLSSRKQSQTIQDLKYSSINSLPIKQLPFILISEQFAKTLQQQKSKTERNLHTNDQTKESASFKKKHTRGQTSTVQVLNSFRVETKYNKSQEKSQFVPLKHMSTETTPQKKSLVGVFRNLSEQQNNLRTSHFNLTKDLKMVSKEVIQGINLNYIILKKSMKQIMEQSSLQDYYQKDEMVYIIMETLKNLEENLSGNCKDKFGLVQNNLQIIGALVSRIMIQLSKVKVDENSICWSQICDTMWKIMVQMIDQVMQSSEENNQTVVQNYAQDLKEELENKQKQKKLQINIKQGATKLNQLYIRITQKVNQLMISRLKKQNDEQIQILQVQLDVTTREFQEFRQMSQKDELEDQAPASMRLVKSNLKDLQSTLKTLEDGMFERESHFAQSLNDLVHFHKNIKKEDTSMRNRISNNYGLFEFSKSQIIDLEQISNCHPFYIIMAQKESNHKSKSQRRILEYFKIDNVEEFLVVWFNKTCNSLQQQQQSDSSTQSRDSISNSFKNQFNLLHSPASLLIKYIKANIYTFMLQDPEHNKIIDGGFILKYQLYLIVKFLKDKLKEEQYCVLFCQIFGLFKMEGISMKNLVQILTLYTQIQKQEQVSDQFFSLKVNKLKWDIKTIVNIVDLVLKIQPNRQITMSWLDTSSNVACILWKIANYLEKQECEQFTQLYTDIQEQFSENKLLNQPEDICFFIIESVEKFFYFTDFDQSKSAVIILSIQDKFIRLNLANSDSWRQFNKEQCDQFAKNALDFVWTVYKKSPNLLKSSFRMKFEQLRLKEYEKILHFEKQFKQSEILKQTPRSQRTSEHMNSSSGQSPEKKPSMLKSLAKKVTMMVKLTPK